MLRPYALDRRGEPGERRSPLRKVGPFLARGQNAHPTMKNGETR
jgi:hypothetical protein